MKPVFTPCFIMFGILLWLKWKVYTFVFDVKIWDLGLFIFMSFLAQNTSHRVRVTRLDDPLQQEGVSGSCTSVVLCLTGLQKYSDGPHRVRCCRCFKSIYCIHRARNNQTKRERWRELEGIPAFLQYTLSANLCNHEWPSDQIPQWTLARSGHQDLKQELIIVVPYEKLMCLSFSDRTYHVPEGWGSDSPALWNLLLLWGGLAWQKT